MNYRQFIFSDHFLCSCDLYVRFSSNFIKKQLNADQKLYLLSGGCIIPMSHL